MGTEHAKKVIDISDEHNGRIMIGKRLLMRTKYGVIVRLGYSGKRRQRGWRITLRS